MFGGEFGNLIMGLRRKKEWGKKNGYAYPPGSGPAGETCGTCEHCTATGTGGKYKKCELLRAVWTGGPGTDIKLSALACRKWTKKEP